MQHGRDQKVGDFRASVIKNAKERFENHIKNTPEYVVQQEHRDGDVVQLWRCGKPHSSTYAFYICNSLNCLAVYGDMGEYIWRRHRNMIPFIRGSIHSLGYFSEKVSSDIRHEVEYRELVEEWMNEIKGHRVEHGYDWGEKEAKELANLREDWSYHEEVERFWVDVQTYPLLCSDFEDLPKTKYYSFHYLWTIEALKWFIKQLDDGKVLPYVEEEKNANS